MKALRRHALGGVALALAVSLAASAAMPAHAQSLLPENLFHAPIDPASPTAVEAEELIFDGVNNVITARGDVVVRISGYIIEGRELVYRRKTGQMEVVGNVSVTDPAGNVSRSETLELTGGARRAVLETMTITAYDGSRVTADSADFDNELRSILTNAEYAPCGECIGKSDQKIGWSLSAARVVQNNEDGSIAFEQPVLSLVGVPVAWLPYLWLPDMSDMPTPNYGYTEKIGLKVEVPVTV